MSIRTPSGVLEPLGRLSLAPRPGCSWYATGHRGYRCAQPLGYLLPSLRVDPFSHGIRGCRGRSTPGYLLASLCDAPALRRGVQNLICALGAVDIVPRHDAWGDAVERGFTNHQRQKNCQLSVAPPDMVGKDSRMVSFHPARVSAFVWLGFVLTGWAAPITYPNQAYITILHESPAPSCLRVPGAES